MTCYNPSGCPRSTCPGKGASHVDALTLLSGFRYEKRFSRGLFIKKNSRRIKIKKLHVTYIHGPLHSMMGQTYLVRPTFWNPIGIQWTSKMETKHALTDQSLCFAVNVLVNGTHRNRCAVNRVLVDTKLIKKWRQIIELMQGTQVCGQRTGQRRCRHDVQVKQESACIRDAPCKRRTSLQLWHTAIYANTSLSPRHSKSWVWEISTNKMPPDV
jgi:hypothetical protein